MFLPQTWIFSLIIRLKLQRRLKRKSSKTMNFNVHLIPHLKNLACDSQLMKRLKKSNLFMYEVSDGLCWAENTVFVLKLFIWYLIEWKLLFFINIFPACLLLTPIPLKLKLISIVNFEKEEKKHIMKHRKHWHNYTSTHFLWIIFALT